MRLLSFYFVLVAVGLGESHSYAEPIADRLAGTWESTLTKDLIKVAGKAFPGSIGKPLSEARVWPWEETNTGKVTLVISRDLQCKMTLKVGGKIYARKQSWLAEDNGKQSVAIKIKAGSDVSDNEIRFQDENQFQLKGDLIDKLFAQSPATFLRAGVYDVASAQRYLIGQWRTEVVVDEARVRHLLLKGGKTKSEIDAKTARQVKNLASMKVTFTFYEDGHFETHGVHQDQEERGNGKWKMIAFRKAAPPIFPHAEIVYERITESGRAQIETVEIANQNQMLTRRFEKLPVRAMLLHRENDTRIATKPGTPSKATKSVTPK